MDEYPTRPDDASEAGGEAEAGPGRWPEAPWRRPSSKPDPLILCWVPAYSLLLDPSVEEDRPPRGRAHQAGLPVMCEAYP
jgi:hypothetical protein